ncbi:hypothetical protein CDD81_2358 [Ophiocordyceps australis]|uniref:Uncharacterized protein n=1 Tax=Ophiocordyceps australis TaxID=1399860 RepID=A0A2C5XU06_9HYPO|nr:hypothetical protein CDD81_2358 [Ophiocordyceps australis]
MLTLKQPPSSTYGYRSVHDLPTPPSTSRPSPPLTYQEGAYSKSSALSRGHSPIGHLMSAPHRGLPPPAAMALHAQQPAPTGVPPLAHHGQPSAALSHGVHAAQQWSALPPPPQQWQGAEESMRNWLLAKAEEEKTRQEEEKTRQESLRLEQRRVEMDMLRASLGGGIPPPMVPLVFAGMAGGSLPQAALDWAQQFMQHAAHGSVAQLPPPQRQHSPDHHQREGHAHYLGASSNPPPGPVAYGPYPASPARPRGQTVTGAIGRQPSIAAQAAQPSTAQMASYHQPPPPQVAAQQEPSPSIYFHHWQPPSSHGGGSSNRPGTPSGESQRKRRSAALSHQPSSEPRLRSPPAFIQSSLSNPPPGRRSHKRQRSDVSWYRSPGQAQGHLADEADGAPRARTPSRGEAHIDFSREPRTTESRKHSVSALLSQDASDIHHHVSRPPFRSTLGPRTLAGETREDETALRDRPSSPRAKGDMRLRGASSAESER